MSNPDPDEQQGFTGPRWAWDVIWETIDMDTKSKSFDAKLRSEIREAAKAIREGGDSTNEPSDD